MFPPRLCAAVTAIALVAAPGSALAAPFSEDFDSGAPGWTTTGLWRVQDRPEAVTVSPAIAGVLTSVPAGSSLPAAWNGMGAAWFGDPATGTYCVGYTAVEQHPSDGCRSDRVVEGTLTSPPFALPRAPATLRFRAWWEIAAGDFDVADAMTAEYSTDGGATWTAAARLNPTAPPNGSLHQPYTSGGLRQPGVWREYDADLTPALGNADVRVRFRFDSVDSLGQGFRGLLIDGVLVAGSEVAAGTPGITVIQLPQGAAGQPGSLPSGPVLGQAVVIEPVSGRTTYTTPGASAPTLLLHPTVVPVGTVVDARAGNVRVTAASDASGGTQSGSFHDGVFKIDQQPTEPLVELALRGGRFPHCDRGCTSARRRATVRRLWGTATGRFRVRGHYAAAAIRGTTWLVEDQPGATVVKVRRGSASVRDFVNDRDVVVNEGETYVARVVYINRERGNPRFGRQYTLVVRNGRVVHRYRKQRVVVGPA